MTPEYREQIKQAEQLTPAECARHALVSTRHKCGCRDCFCCACAHVEYSRAYGLRSLSHKLKARS